MASLIYMEVEARFAKAAFRVNDIPVWRARGEARQGAGVCLNGILHGQDRVDIRGTWAREADAPPQGRITLNLAVYQPEETIGVDGERFLDERLVDTGADPVIAHRAEVRSPAVGRWNWMAADPAESAAPGARDLVGRLLQAFRDGQADTMFAAMQPALDDRAGAFPDDSVEAFVERLRPGFALVGAAGDQAPLPAELVLQPAADGRLLEVLDRAGAPFVRKRLADGRDYRLPLLIGRRGSDWRVYR